MTIKIACPTCLQKYRLQDELAGKKAKCAKCGASIRIPAPAVAAAPPAPDLSDLFDESLGDEPATPPTPTRLHSACPKCAAPLDKAAVLCVKCGYNTRTGQQLSTQRDPAAAGAPSRGGSQTSANKASPLGGLLQQKSLLVGSLLSLGGAIIGAAIWVGIVYATGYEIGWIAWGLGAAAGAGMALCHDEGDGTFAGIIAGAMSIVGILAAKGFIYVRLRSQLADLGMDEEELAALAEIIGESLSFSMMFSPMDGVFFLLAVVTAYKVAGSN